LDLFHEIKSALISNVLSIFLIRTEVFGEKKYIRKCLPKLMGPSESAPQELSSEWSGL
jgi:hypothetical protein